MLSSGPHGGARLVTRSVEVHGMLKRRSDRESRKHARYTSRRDTERAGRAISRVRTKTGLSWIYHRFNLSLRDIKDAVRARCEHCLRVDTEVV